MGSDNQSKYYLFGRDITTIPCLRTCALTGLGSGFAVGILHFLLTSNAMKSPLYGYCTFIGVTFPYWFYCTQQEYQKLAMVQTIQKELAKSDDEYIITDSLEFGTETFG